MRGVMNDGVIVSCSAIQSVLLWEACSPGGSWTVGRGSWWGEEQQQVSLPPSQPIPLAVEVWSAVPVACFFPACISKATGCLALGF